MPFSIRIMRLKITNILTAIVFLLLLGSQQSNASETSPEVNIKTDRKLGTVILFSSTKFNSTPPEPNSLEFGSLLINPRKEAYINTPHCSVKVKKGAIALILVSPIYSKILNLHAKWKGHLTVSKGMNTFKVPPGRELAIIKCESEKDALKIHMVDGIHRRRLRDEKLDDGHVAIIDDYSIVDILRHNRLLKKAKDSNEKPARRIISKILHTHATLQSTDPHQVPYRLY